MVSWDGAVVHRARCGATHGKITNRARLRPGPPGLCFSSFD
ncbi:MAG: hypothetical protein AVDCRST_MAG70-1245 [uncultured Thermomicrobiales bacterium]|uniref:Uncharacterized protein n=1 Tax=uncultured Thermomicrobiales bacterium TaxID=1645740 RepID=A0A6J4UQD1_9BACT|nr:MAG: hypothetical protein AVDCRST_MAG70-1245 [uncultured Thermomicrobiales bacterium]